MAFHVRKYGAQLGKKRWYLISTLVDESFSLNYMAKIPDHLDKGWYMFFVSFLSPSLLGHWSGIR